LKQTQAVILGQRSAYHPRQLLAARMKPVMIVPLILLSLVACTPDSTQSKVAALPVPATVDNPRQESALSRVTLSHQATQRLGIETTRVQLKHVAKTRLVGGVIMEPPGRYSQIVAPFPGKVLTAAGKDFPLPG